MERRILTIDEIKEIEKNRKMHLAMTVFSTIFGAYCVVSDEQFLITMGKFILLSLGIIWIPYIIRFISTCVLYAKVYILKLTKQTVFIDVNRKESKLWKKS